MPPLCASFIQNVITLTGHLFIGKKCGVSKHSYLSIKSQIVPVNKQIKSNQQLMTLLIVYILDDMSEITCTRSRCSRHYLFCISCVFINPSFPSRVHTASDRHVNFSYVDLIKRSVRCRFDTING